MRKQRRVCSPAFICMLVIFILAPLQLKAQTQTGTIVGTVTDPSAARVPGVKVSVLNPDTGFISETVTSGEGDYRVPYLNPGIYRLSFEVAGFKKLIRDGIELRTNDTARVDVTLEVGEPASVIEVSGAAPLLETETSATGTVLEGTMLNRLPSPQRYIQSVLFYLPGATAINGEHISGQRNRQLNYTMDGIQGAEPVRGGIATNRFTSTTQDAVEEIKVWTTTLPAEFGHSAGGLLSAVYKSGTNKLHGTAEDRYLNRKLLHRNYFDPTPRQATNPFTYHEMSATLGGPVFLPKLYNGKDRTFFFFGFQRHHEKASEGVFADVPNPAMYNGDFSFNGLGFPIYDPLTTRQDATGAWIRDPFPGNKIPVERIDPVIKNFLSRNPWKQENFFSGSGFIDRLGPHQNYGAGTVYRSYRTRFDGKLDHQFQANHKIFGRYSHVRHRSFAGRWLIQIDWPLIDRFHVPIPIDQRNFVVADTITINPTTVQEFRFGFNRRKFSRTPESLNQGWGKKLGIPNVSDATFPEFRNAASTPARIYEAGPGGGPGAVADGRFEVTENFTVQDNLTFIRGRHSFKTGYELLRTRANSKVETLPTGIFRFGGTEFPFMPNTGNDFASFLLGTVVRADFNTELATWLPRWINHAGYLQDDWKVNSKLTLNLGIRWSYESPFNTKYGQMAQFDTAAIDALTGRRGAITHPSGPLAKRDLNNFQPRFGMAYQLAKKWVFRGGYGVNTVDLFSNGLNQNFEEYLATAVIQPPPGDPRHVFRISEGPPPFQFNILPNGTSPFLGTNFAGRNASWYDPNLRAPYVMNWNSTLQYEFAPTFLLELSYQGSAAVGLLNNWDINAIPLDISRDPVLLNQIFAAPQNFKPYTQFGAINHYSNYGHNTYHSGTIKVEKRLSRGLTFTSFYTYGKTINDADDDGTATGITFYNRRLEKGRANYDVNHRTVTYATFELPWGKGRRFMNQGGVRDAIFGGWDLSWIQTFETGVPINFTFLQSPHRYLPGQMRPDRILPNDQVRVKNFELGERFNVAQQNSYLSLKAFAYPAPFTPGNAGRNIISGPGLSWAQGSLAKEFRIREGAGVQVRFDVQNVFKNPNFQNPNAVVNFTNPVNFGKIRGTNGGFSGLGARTAGFVIVKVFF